MAARRAGGSETMPIRACVFDAYGTLYDVQSVFGAVERACPGRGVLVTQLWRLKQLEYTWLRSTMDAYQDFAVVTHDSLVFALRAAGVDPAPTLVAGLADAYLHLDPYPEALAALAALAPLRCAILSNGSPAMLDALVANSGLAPLLRAVISVDPTRAFKPNPRCYALVEPALGVAPADVLFVSSNGFDVAGAKRFGFRVAWIRRGGGPGICPPDADASRLFTALRANPEELGFDADRVLSALTELPSLLG